MLRVTYVWHSCFVVELDKNILVFDYFPKEAVETVHFEGKMPELDANKHIYVFASHSLLSFAKPFPRSLSVDALQYTGTGGRIIHCMPSFLFKDTRPPS